MGRDRGKDGEIKSLRRQGVLDPDFHSKFGGRIAAPDRNAG